MTELDKSVRYGFLPGCSLSSYSPADVTKTVEYLNAALPKFSALLRCCGKPTKDLGERAAFERRFAQTQRDMADIGAERMILACPNCKKVFDELMPGTALSLWEVLQKIGIPEELRGKAKNSDIVFTIHDPCSARYDTAAQDGVRWLLTELGYRYEESEHSRGKTRCCGFGGQVEAVDPALAAQVMQRRLDTLPQRSVVTYCSTCRSAFMQSGRQAWHILDLLWGSVVYADSAAPEDVLINPDDVWHNRFLTRKGMIQVVNE